MNHHGFKISRLTKLKSPTDVRIRVEFHHTSILSNWLSSLLVAYFRTPIFFPQNIFSTNHWQCYQWSWSGWHKLCEISLVSLFSLTKLLPPYNKISLTPTIDNVINGVEVDEIHCLRYRIRLRELTKFRKYYVYGTSPSFLYPPTATTSSKLVPSITSGIAPVPFLLWWYLTHVPVKPPWFLPKALTEIGSSLKLLHRCWSVPPLKPYEKNTKWLNLV